MLKSRIIAAILLILAAFVGYFSFKSQSFPYKLGLDLSGGSHLVYQADISKISPDQIDDAMKSLKDVVEKRINIFGVSEPIIETEVGGRVGNPDHRLVVELPGITDLAKAEATIGKTPQLEFMLVDDKVSATLSPDKPVSAANFAKMFISTGLDGSLVKSAAVTYNQTTYQPIVALTFNDAGAKLFDKITRENVGSRLAIFLDGNFESSPVIQEEIPSGNAQITGNFTLDEAKALVRDLNFGALPVPVKLLSTKTVGATLGSTALDASIMAGIFAFIIVSIFLISWYRLPGLVASIALLIYTALNLSLYKLIPVVLTSAGIAGFILSIGMAVDANILIFERMKEEIKRGRLPPDAIKEGFARAWLSIRDSNLSSIITALILYYFASTPIIKGFALVFLIGVLVSMFTAITVTRTFLMAVHKK